MHEAERKRCVTVGVLALTVGRKKGNLEGKTDLAHHTRWAHPIYAVGVRKVANGQARWLPDWANIQQVRPTAMSDYSYFPIVSS